MKRTTGAVIKTLRKRSGMTQSELGDLLGVKRGTVQKYEGDDISLSADTVKALCTLFGVPPWVLLFPEDDATELTLEVVGNYYSKFYALNHIGRMKVNDYITDLSKIPAYQRGNL